MFGYYLEVSAANTERVPRAIPAPADARRRGAVHHGRAEAARVATGRRPRAPGGTGEAGVQLSSLSRFAAAPQAQLHQVAEALSHAGRGSRPRRMSAVENAATCVQRFGEALRWPSPAPATPVVEAALGAGRVRSQRLQSFDERAPDPRPDRAEHERQIHLSATGGPDCTHGTGRFIRAGRKGRGAAPCSTASSPVSGPKTTSPPGSLRSWWRWWKLPRSFTTRRRVRWSCSMKLAVGRARSTAWPSQEFRDRISAQSQGSRCLNAVRDALP